MYNILTIKNNITIWRKSKTNIFKPRQISGLAILTSNLVDGNCRAQSSVAFSDLAIRIFPWFSPKLAKTRAKISMKDPHGRHSPCKHMHHMRTIGLNPKTPLLLPLYGTMEYEMFNISRKWNVFTLSFQIYVTFTFLLMNQISNLIPIKHP